MKTIWKWKLEIGKTKIDMPQGSRILRVDKQDDISKHVVFIWALVNPRSTVETRTFNIYTTGQQLPENEGEYIDTVLLDGGLFVAHIFETSDKE